MPKYPNNEDLRLFKRWGVDELSRELAARSNGLVSRSPQYLLQVRSGYTPLSEEFKDVISKVMGEPKEILFAPEEGSQEEEGREQEAERR